MKYMRFFLFLSLFSLVSCSHSLLENHSNRNASVMHENIFDSMLPISSLGSSNQSVCPAGMQLVDGNYCPNVQEECLQWSGMRCLRFREPTRCLSEHRIHMRFCIDTYEHGNASGFPQTMVTYFQASRTCRDERKRLPTSAEWTLACEGDGDENNPYETGTEHSSILPYPYGYNRDNLACNIDHPGFIAPNRALLGSPIESVAMGEAHRIYMAERNGTRPGCRSPFNVMNLTGNVDEWVTAAPTWGSLEHRPYRSWLAGGDWRFVRTRCRPRTTAHGPSFRYYNIGFRCSMDIPNP